MKVTFDFSPTHDFFDHKRSRAHSFERYSHGSRSSIYCCDSGAGRPRRGCRFESSLRRQALRERNSRLGPYNGNNGTKNLPSPSVARPFGREGGMIGMLKRHEIEILLKAGHSQPEVARLSGVGLRSVRRIAKESSVVDVDDAAEREKRRIGRPNVVENFREQVEAILKQEADLPSLEILRRVREAGYPGGKTALYELVASLRPQVTQPLVRFEGLPGEFSQHDFGQVKGAVPQWLPAARSFLCLAVEVLAPYPRQFG